MKRILILSVSRTEPRRSTAVEQQEAKTENCLIQEALQKVVEDWASPKQTDSSRASVVLMDEDGTANSGFKSDTEFFAASIYKLFVTYEGYRAVDAKTVNPNEVYQGGRTRMECLDLMIRESDSPCAEKMWEELGKQELTDTLITYGIENTSMTGLSTTAEDAGKILARILRGEGLSESSRLAYLSSMKDQDALYRKGFPSGFSSEVTVYNKVGWNEQLEYHDVGIIETADGRKLIYAVMTENVGSKQIAQLAKEIEATF
jgi:beta-lactamase class A